MMKSLKFQPGTFLEVEDLSGGRKVVMVCKDGVTYWDNLNVQESTPVVIHETMKPIELGTMATFCTSNGLQKAMKRMYEFSQIRLDTRSETDSLFAMRVLWFLAQKISIGAYSPTDDDFNWAFQQVKAQEETAIRIHKTAQRFYAD